MFLEPEVRIKLADEPWEIEKREEEEIRLPALPVWQSVMLKQESHKHLNREEIDIRVVQQPYNAKSPVVDNNLDDDIIILDSEKEENMILAKKENRDER
ncbi:hypothetical protein Pmani_029340 [Petrolisthes manimaculis]|uniref:Uncharacterized protein n=1 Tax=Petrolisthes manimaculis TaxID=1843537 RepID=A0AAE1P0D3_9EUCA|nr:hypothetical protein Pmani_029340 [Petrolisthes manimaculis]